ncbi:hypothetical protein Sa4125_16470 [Aureimonas sp. SA4125]|uniref:hypothetical protein n=1 Tax=Aureimonas sp. SA4125 TaxID=2826993 RepID=UPI001CC35124|nr:hypothetical protein [Aureimonas sp. SA4125]BDA84105.1 hypothetical protein Sa4125_16470 [Aureimonas sp. SA4125]
MTRRILLAVATLLAVGSAHADEIRPMAGKSFALASGSGVVYFTKEAEGFRVVATMNAGEGATPVRIVSTLADGQTMTLSIPTEVGRNVREIEIRRAGETLSIDTAPALMVRASLN